MTARMSPSEAIMWAAEKDPALRSDFSNLTLLDRVPDADRLRAKVEQALVSLPRLAERVVTPPLRIAPPEWRPDPTLDLDYHLRRVALPQSGSLRNLLDVAATLSATPLDRSRPLWEFTLIEGLAEGRAALLQRVHHAVTDGVGGLKLSLSLVDFEREPVPDVHDTVKELADNERTRQLHDMIDDPLERDSPLGVLRDAIEFAWQRNIDLARRGVAVGAGIALHPTAMPKRAQDAVGMATSLRRQVLVAGRAKSRLLATRSLGRRYDVFSIGLEDTRAAAHALGGSINDVFVTGVAGALGLYHDRLGIPVDDLRMAMAVSTRSGHDTAGNQFVPTRVVVPVTPKEPAARFNLVKDKITNVRHEPALAAADTFAGLAAGLPTSVIVGLLRNQTRSVDFATSNLRGSPIDLYLGGARILASYPLGPRSGCAINVTALSYCGDLCLGIHSDPAAVTDPEAFVECLRESFDALLATGV
ncbi:MAG: wax ester/triacylglycerol synthase domain-containing protein [Acidimicrobiia bacterium]